MGELVKEYYGKELIQKQLLQQLIGKHLPRIIAFVGGGGKTTAIFFLAETLQMQGYKVIVTTTTHMHRTRDFILPDHLSNIASVLDKRGIVFTGFLEEDGKITGNNDLIERLLSMCDVVLVEADGARCQPVKAPEQWEPVIPRKTELVIGMAGCLALGKRIDTASHRPAIVSDLLRKKKSQVFTWRDLVFLLSDIKGQKKGVHCPYAVLIGQADQASPKVLSHMLLEFKQQEVTSFAVSFYKECLWRI
ncbi:MAG: putative selenium-dependent hydroxylase accessory protein YqeC [Clostridiales bacterium]|nr:putative selenium-dependent hydroxylase accessory protein YqeC [Clostridiales bacterium]